MAEVQEIIVKYIGDASDLNKEMKSVEEGAGKTAKKLEEIPKKLDEGTKQAEKTVRGFSKTLGLLTKTISAAFAAKAVLNFGKALIDVSLATDEMRPKVAKLKDEYQRFLEVLGGQSGIASTLDGIVTSSTDILTAFNSILSNQNLSAWQKLKGILIDIKVNADGVDFTGLSAPEAEKGRKTVAKLKEELTRLRAKGKQEIIDEGQVRVNTANKISRVTKELAAIEKALKDATVANPFDEEKKTKAVEKRTKATEVFVDLTRLQTEEITNQDERLESLRKTYRLLFGKDLTPEMINDLKSSWEDYGEAVEGTGEIIDNVLPDSVERLREVTAAVSEVAQVLGAYGKVVSAVSQLVGEDAEKQAEFQKKLSIFTIALYEGVAIAGATKAAAGSAFNPIQLAIQVASSIATVLLAIAQAKKAVDSAGDVPQFAKGVIDLRGPGTGTSDSIPAYLSAGESVMTAMETKKNKDVLQAIRADRFDQYIIDAYLPKILDKEKKANKSFADNLANAIPMAAYNDARLRDVIMKGYIKGDRNTTRIVQAITTTSKSNRRGF